MSTHRFYKMSGKVQEQISETFCNKTSAHLSKQFITPDSIWLQPGWDNPGQPGNHVDTKS